MKTDWPTYKGYPKLFVHPHQYKMFVESGMDPEMFVIIKKLPK